MAKRNRHGLSRYIESSIRLRVRQRCGFGCVVCGLGIVDYEHFAPEFCDAKKHDENGITLLCPGCNQKKNRGMLSTSTVNDANQDPKCLQRGFSNDSFDFGTGEVEVNFASWTIKHCQHLISVKGTPILSLEPPESLNAPLRLSGAFLDTDGKSNLRIAKNIWFAGTTNWDVRTEGPRLILRTASGKIALQILFDPPHRVTVEKIHMRSGEIVLKGSTDGLKIFQPETGWGTYIGGAISGNPEYFGNTAINIG